MDENPKRIDARLEIKVTEHFTPKERERRRRAEKVADGLATASVGSFLLCIIVGLLGLRCMNASLFVAAFVLLVVAALLKLGQYAAKGVYNNPSLDADDDGGGGIFPFGPWSYF